MRLGGWLRLPPPPQLRVTPRPLPLEMHHPLPGCRDPLMPQDCCCEGASHPAMHSLTLIRRINVLWGKLERLMQPSPFWQPSRMQRATSATRFWHRSPGLHKIR